MHFEWDYFRIRLVNNWHWRREEELHLEVILFSASYMDGVFGVVVFNFGICIEWDW